MSAPVTPVAWAQIDGGRDALLDAFAAIEDQAIAMQGRFSAALDLLGPPGVAAWDPVAGTIELRGHTFRAQQLGSFDGASWLWSWANRHLEIPEAKTVLARGLRDAAERLAVPALRMAMIADDDEELADLLGGVAIAHGFGEAFFYANQSQIYLIEPGQLDEIERRPPVTRRFATVFSHARRSLADVLAHLRGDRQLAALAWTQVDDDHATVAGTGYALTLARCDRLRDVLAEIKALPHGQDTARGAATVFTLEGTLDRSYAETSFASTYGAWAPADFVGTAGVVPWQAISICERFNKLDRLALYDALLNTFYPRS